MQLTLRPYVTAGVALVGASVIAATPIAPLPLDIQVPATVTSSAAVELSALSGDLAGLNPIPGWATVLQQSSDNLTEIFTRATTNPALQKVLQAKLEYYGDQLFGGYPAFLSGLANWATTTLPAGLQQAFEEVLAGEPALATQTITDALMGVIWVGMGMSGWLQVPQELAEDLTATVKSMFSLWTVTDILNGVVTLPLSGPFKSLGVSAQSVVDAMEAGDPVAALSAIVNAPANAVNALLNGSSGLLDFRSMAGGRVIFGGLLTSLLVNMPERLAKALPPVPVTTATTTSVTDTSLTRGTLVAVNAGSAGPAVDEPGPAALPAAPSSPSTPDSAAAAPQAAAEAPAAPESVTEEAAADITGTPGALDAESDGATGISDGNKVTPGAVTLKGKHRQATRLNTTLKSIGTDADNTVSKVSDAVKKAFGSKKKDSKSSAGSNSTGSDSRSSDSNSGGSAD